MKPSNSVAPALGIFQSAQSADEARDVAEIAHHTVNCHYLYEGKERAMFNNWLTVTEIDKDPMAWDPSHKTIT